MPNSEGKPGKPERPFVAKELEAYIRLPGTGLGRIEAAVTEWAAAGKLTQEVADGISPLIERKAVEAVSAPALPYDTEAIAKMGRSIQSLSELQVLDAVVLAENPEFQEAVRTKMGEYEALQGQYSENPLPAFKKFVEDLGVSL
jgi:hypothetical protein